MIAIAIVLVLEIIRVIVIVTKVRTKRCGTELTLSERINDKSGTEGV